MQNCQVNERIIINTLLNKDYYFWKKVYILYVIALVSSPTKKTNNFVVAVATRYYDNKGFVHISSKFALLIDHVQWLSCIIL